MGWALLSLLSAAEAIPLAAAEAGGCNRGFSFECFSLGINGNELLFPGVEDNDDNNNNGGKGGGNNNDNKDAIGGRRGRWRQLRPQAPMLCP
jgi:hypothetical protein